MPRSVVSEEYDGQVEVGRSCRPGRAVCALVSAEFSRRLGIPASPVSEFPYGRRHSRHNRTRPRHGLPSASHRPQHVPPTACRHGPRLPAMATGTAMTTPRQETPALDRRSLRKLMAAGLIGSSIEWYDFFIYATAGGVVVGGVVFAHAPPPLA